MDTLIKESIAALTNEELLSMKEPETWINYGSGLIEKQNTQWRLSELDEDADYAAKTILETGLTTKDEIVGYHGNVNIQDFSDKYLSLTKCISTAINFGKVYKIRIPKNVPAFYISAWGLLTGEQEWDTETETLLPQGKLTYISEYEEKCTCGFLCCNKTELITELQYELL